MFFQEYIVAKPIIQTAALISVAKAVSQRVATMAADHLATTVAQEEEPVPVDRPAVADIAAHRISFAVVVIA